MEHWWRGICAEWSLTIGILYFFVHSFNPPKKVFPVNSLHQGRRKEWETWGIPPAPTIHIPVLSHGKPVVNAVGLELSPDDANLFKDINSGLNSINAAVKLSKSRKKAAELDAEEDTTEDF
ncbi:hypothetical protein C8R44DRAFT_734093 [Mycena epipterygia]|nr:hypothetical protein C8R44DRAFT_734093 [Mycena epipterygia]